MYELVSENLSNLGGRMGTEYTTTNFRKFFKTFEGAQKAAEKDYEEKIKWKKVKTGVWRSPDLAYVMYHIKHIKTED